MMRHRLEFRPMGVCRHQRSVADEKYRETRDKVKLGIEDVNTRVPLQTDLSSRPTILQCAIDNNDEEFIDFLLSKEGIQINLSTRCYGTALHHAIEKGKHNIVRKLVNAGADVNAVCMSRYDFMNPLQLAIRKHQIKISEFLVSRGADPLTLLRSTSSISPLRMAVREGKEEIVKFLIKHGADINEKSTHFESLLIDAVRHRNNKIVKYLLDSDVDPNFPSNGGCNVTPLHIAIDTNNVDAVKLLLNHDNIDINRVTSNGNSVLDYAIFTDDITIVKSLLHAGIDFNKVAASYFDDSRSFCDVIPLIRRHTVKLSAANLYVMNKTLNDIIDRNQYAKNYRQKCYAEVDSMRKTKIANTNISFYDVLQKSIHAIAHFLSCINIKDDDPIYDEYELKEKFPLYSGMIYFKLNKAKQRHHLLENVDDLIFETLSRDLPYTIVRNISCFFSNRELKQLNEKIITDLKK
ncbi:GSCOCG00011795001-RA-CDS [Cotesia congregata]|nr:GSCOCG00011795001-RA-CDS [Cotesia congregata]